MRSFRDTKSLLDLALFPRPSNSVALWLPIRLYLLVERTYNGVHYSREVIHKLVSRATFITTFIPSEEEGDKSKRGRELHNPSSRIYMTWECPIQQVKISSMTSRYDTRDMLLGSAVFGIEYICVCYFRRPNFFRPENFGGTILSRTYHSFGSFLCWRSFASKIQSVFVSIYFFFLSVKKKSSSEKRITPVVSSMRNSGFNTLAAVTGQPVPFPGC